MEVTHTHRQGSPEIHREIQANGNAPRDLHLRDGLPPPVT